MAQNYKKGFILLLCPSDSEAYQKLRWATLTSSRPRLSSTNKHYLYIYVQYFTLMKKAHAVQNSYFEWNVIGKTALKWKADSTQLLC